MPARDRDPTLSSAARERAGATRRAQAAQPEEARPAELAVLRLQQQAGNAALTSAIQQQPERRSGRIGPPPRPIPTKPAGQPASIGTGPGLHTTSGSPAGRASAPSGSSQSAAAPPTPLPSAPLSTDGHTLDHRLDADAARDSAHHEEVPLGDGPTADEGAAQLLAAQVSLDEAVAESAVETTAPGTAAGAVIVAALAEGGTAARAQLAGGVGAAAAALQSVAAGVAAGVAQTEAAELAAAESTDRQASTAISAGVEGAQSQVVGEHGQQTAAVGASSAAALQSGDQGVAQEADRVRQAGREQARQTLSVGAQTGAATAAELGNTASRTAAGTGGKRGGDVAQAYDQVDQKISADTAAQMRGAAVQAQIGMQTHAGQAASTMLDASEQAASTVGQEASVLRGRLAATNERSGAVLADTAGQAGQQLARQGTAAVRQLAGSAATGREVLRVRGDQARGVVTAAAARLVTRLAGQARRAMAASRRSQAGAARRLKNVRLSSTGAAATAATAKQQLVQQHLGAVGQAAAMADAGAASLGTAQAELGDALHGLGADQRSVLADAASRVAAGAHALAGLAGQALRQTAEEARTAGSGLVDATRRNLGTATALAGSGLAQATTAVRDHLAERQTDAATRSGDAAAGARERVGQGQQRLDQSMAGGPQVQRGILGDIVDWVGDQLSDLFDLLSNPGFWVGLLVAVVLFPVMGPASIVVGGAAGGLVSGIHDNVKNGRPWYEPHTLIKHVAIGTFAGAAFVFGGGVLLGLGLEGGALLGGTMLLSAGVGVGVNVATGERWDKGLVANLFLGWLFHKVGGSGKGRGDSEGTGGRGGQERTGRERTGEERTGDDESSTARPQPGPAGRPAAQTRAQALVERIVRLQERHAATRQPDPALQGRLQADLNNARALAERAEQAGDDAAVRAVERELKAAEKRAYDAAVQLGRVQVSRLVDALARRIAALRDRIPANVAQKHLAQLGRLRTELDTATQAREALAREVPEADSQRQIEALGDRATKINQDLDAWEAAHDNLLRPSEAPGLGVSPEAADAFRVIEAKAYDPLGDYNRGEDGRVTNHYAAARREAAGERVGPADPNEKPFDHIRDLQNARDAVSNARRILEDEAANPRPDITDRAIRVLLEKIQTAGRLLRRVDEFLQSIGWPADRPHRWVQENGRWVGEGDPVVIRPRLAGRVNDARAIAEGLDRTILRNADPANRPALQAERQAIMNEADAINGRLEAAQNEAGLVAEEPAIGQLENRANALRQNSH